MNRTLISIPQLAERWDVNVKTIYGMIERGELRRRDKRDPLSPGEVIHLGVGWECSGAAGS